MMGVPVPLVSGLSSLSSTGAENHQKIYIFNLIHQTAYLESLVSVVLSGSSRAQTLVQSWDWKLRGPLKKTLQTEQ